MHYHHMNVVKCNNYIQVFHVIGHILINNVNLYKDVINYNMHKQILIVKDLKKIAILNQINV